MWKIAPREGDQQTEAVSFFRTISTFPEWPIDKGGFSAEQRQLALSVMCKLSLLWLSPV
ncbi:hypothetical protein LguiA_035956 [Lonicera macranthoides]